MKPALRVGLDEIAVETSGISEKLDRPLPLKAGLRVASGGRLVVEGKLLPATAAIDLQLKLDDLALNPAQPFIGKYAALDLVSGRVSAAGRLRHDARGSSYKGSFGVSELRLNEAGSDKVFLAWKYLGSKQLEATPQKLQVGELMLDGLDTQLLIARDKSTNFQRILRKADAQPPAAPEAKADAAAPPAVAPATEGSPRGAPTSAPAAPEPSWSTSTACASATASSNSPTSRCCSRSARASTSCAAPSPVFPRGPAQRASSNSTDRWMTTAWRAPWARSIPSTRPDSPRSG